MARKAKKQKVDRNLGLSPDLIYKKRSLRFAILVWFLATLVLIGATIAVIQAGPFDLDLAVNPDQTSAQGEVRDFSAALLGGFSFLWLLIAILPAVFYYRHVIKRRLPSLRQAKALPPAVAAV